MGYLRNLIAGLAAFSFAFSSPTGLEARVNVQELNATSHPPINIPDLMLKSRADYFLEQGKFLLHKERYDSAYSNLVKSVDYYKGLKDHRGDLEYAQSLYHLGRACWYLGIQNEKDKNASSKYFKLAVEHLNGSKVEFNTFISNNQQRTVPFKDKYLIGLNRYLASSYIQLNEVKNAFRPMLELISLEDNERYIKVLADFTIELSDSERNELVQKIRSALSEKKAKILIDRINEAQRPQK